MIKLDRREVLKSSIAAAAAATMLPLPASAAHPGVTVGAIRWDAWYAGPASLNAPQAQSNLSPQRYQSRAPACATVINDHTISLDSCVSQSAIDAEITAAHGAGLDYWAYDWYGTTRAIQNAWRFHQTSSIKNQMNWCHLWSSYTNFHLEIQSSMADVMSRLAQSNYQRVISGRPLVCLLADSYAVVDLAADITAFRAACGTAGVGNPYIVLVSHPVPIDGVLAATGADALGFYATNSSPIAEQPYSGLVALVEQTWQTRADSGQASIPTAMTGWDHRPMVERPNAAGGPQTAWRGWLDYVVAGTPSEIAAHVGRMLQFLRDHPTECPAQTGLVYSWNEHSEGGSTLNPSLGGRAILDAVAGVL
ncbi:hypothetical protein GJ654_18870 [Rhodoblastus acidophilus]|uniref:Uncharacterized protein n=1 Tax=Rhodoblastus acidophilus TaxID=1074 RepID=A0A6N8DRK7_RHOAC|nr:hypothetical protein [Rhodoblastus acidophilus]MCW2276392.1 hypothetical protein [Rhodoblastus acidophilus]MTV33047.1 hypothetical protein [Rhodoblastus acidophilus]